MGKYDFDKLIERTLTDSIKWNFIQDELNPSTIFKTNIFNEENGVLPMWVADMDFLCPPEVVESLIARAKHGIYGYTARSAAYNISILNWMKKRHSWNICEEWLCVSPGVVPALNMLINSFAMPGDGVLVQTPVYYPFFRAVENNGRKVVDVPLLLDDSGNYRMDYDSIESKISDGTVKLAILCNPHNPVGRVWKKEELLRFAEICLKNKVTIISDEIHADLTYKNCKFTPLASLSKEIANITVTCTSASKTFNIAGLHNANIIISSPELRKKYMAVLSANGLFGMNIFGMIATEIAYSKCEQWLDELLDYLHGNLVFLKEFIAVNIPAINVIEPEGTYLVWLDLRKLTFSALEQRRFILNKAKLFLDEGYIFGKAGVGFTRMNIGCPRMILEKALVNLANAVNSLQETNKL